MSDDIIIRKARSSDAADIARIYNYAISNTTATFDMVPKSVEDRVDWLKSHGDRYPVFVAELDSKVVGWASLGPYGVRPAYRYTVENALYIDCDYQGRGIGKRLMQELLNAAGELGYHAVIALIVGGNESSIGIHRKFGFEMMGVMREVGRKFDRWLDIHIYEKVLETNKQN